MKHLIKLLFLFVVFKTLHSCSPLLLKTYGMKEMKSLSKVEIMAQGSKYKIPENDAYVLDSSYIDFIFLLDSTKYAKEIQNHFQPLQALYYDQTGQLKSYHINCNAGGFPNLKWNRFGNFDAFIPKQQTPIDSILPLNQHLKHLVPLTDEARIFPDAYDFIVIVHWSRFMGRQSKRLIKIVQKNATLSKNYNTKIVYVNNDNLFGSLVGN